MADKKSFLVYFEWEEPFSCLDNAELGELFRAMVKYAKNEEEPEFENKTLYLVFTFIKNAIDRDKAAYEERCKKNAENASKGGKRKAEIYGKNEKYDANLDFSELLEKMNK